MTLRNNSLGTYDPATGTTSVAYTDSNPNAAVFDFGEGETVGPGGMVQQGDKKAFLEVGVVPSLEDHLILADGTEYTIKGVGKLDPSGSVPVLYILHLRT